MIPIRPPLAMALALCLPGAGHLYAGWPTHAVVFAALFPATLAGLCVATATEALSVGLFVPLVILLPLVLQVAAAIDAGRKASTPVLAPHRVSNRAVVVGFALGSVAVSLFTMVALERTTLSLRRMSSATMTPSLLVGDYVVLRRPAFMSPIAQDDLLEFRFPRDRRFIYLQRVVATGGDSLILSAGAPPTLDGEALDWADEEPGRWQAPDCTFQEGRLVVETSEDGRSHGVLAGEDPRPGQALEVPRDAFFVANDNRTYRGDSRQFGPIAASEVSGQVVGIGFSWDPCAGRARLERVGDLD